MSLFNYGHLGLVSVVDPVAHYEALPAVWTTPGPGSKFKVLRILTPQRQDSPHSTTFVGANGSSG